VAKSIKVLGTLALGGLLWQLWRAEGPPNVAAMMASTSQATIARPQGAPVKAIAARALQDSERRQEEVADEDSLPASDDPAAFDPDPGKLMEEPFGDVRICDNLGRVTRYPDAVGTNFATDFDQAWRDSERTDPVAEAVRLPYKALLRDDAVRVFRAEREQVFSSLDGIPQEQRISQLKSWGFYDRAVQAVQDLAPRREKYNNIFRRAHHLAVLARVAALRPEVVGRLGDFCQRVEKSIVEEEKVDIGAERHHLVRLMDEVGVTPEQVGFNIEEYPEFEVGWYWDQGMWIVPRSFPGVARTRRNKDY